VLEFDRGIPFAEFGKRTFGCTPECSAGEFFGPLYQLVDIQNCFSRKSGGSIRIFSSTEPVE